MLLSDLQSKDIISVKTGDNLGRIIDVEINEAGQIINIYTETKRVFRKIFNSVTSFLYYCIINRDCCNNNKRCKFD